MIVGLVRKRRWQILLAGGLSAGSALLTTALLAYLNALAGTGVAADPAGVALRLVVLLAATFVAGIVAQGQLARFSAATLADLRRTLSERFIDMDYQQMAKLGAHRVTGALVGDVQQLSGLLLILPLFFFHSVTLAGCAIYLLTVSWQLFLVLAVFVTAAVGASRLMMSRFRQHFRAARGEEDKLFEAFNALSSGKKELSVNPARARHFLAEVILPSLDAARNHAYTAQSWWSYSGTVFSTLHLCGMSCILYLGNLWVRLPELTITQAFVISAFVLNPLSFLIVALRDINIGRTSIARLEALGLKLDAAPASPVGPKPEWTTLAVRGLAHRYDAERHGFAFGPVDFAFRRGEVVFVVGGNGSGKSTFLLLLAGLLAPTGGGIELDGRAVGAGDVASYRQVFSAVFFDFHLFRQIVDQSGRPAPDDRVNELLARLDLQDKVQAVGGALSTLELSQGQRKRLALVQAYVDEGDVFLFDEWAADQDPESKEYFYLELLPELRARGKTVVAVTHDEKYFHCADRRLKLEVGRVADEPADDQRVAG